MSLRTWFFLRRHKRVCNRTIASARELACEALARDVEKRRNSFECEQFRRRRAAMLRVTRAQIQGRR
jgi:hypothetical protein